MSIYTAHRRKNAFEENHLSNTKRWPQKKFRHGGTTVKGEGYCWCHTNTQTVLLWFMLLVCLMI